jgi:excisionase family DNA binding protein
MTVTPAPEESTTARTALFKLERAIQAKQSVRLGFADSSDEVAVPPSALAILGQVLANIADGESFSIMPAGPELTTQQAADQLGVSRPFLVKLLEGGCIEYRKVGTHRRVKAAALMRYKQSDDATRRVAADALAAETYELGLT